jgi:hypothetical protein
MIFTLVACSEKSTDNNSTVETPQAEATDMELEGPPAEAQGGPGVSGDMMSVDDANALESKLLSDAGYKAAVGGYPIVDTNATTFYSNDAIIDAPAEGESFYGQDASYTGNEPSYTDNGDGTITDNVTGLIWQQDPGEKMLLMEVMMTGDFLILRNYKVL